MIMTFGFRRFALTAHVTTSVGWLGAVAAFLALALAGLTSPDAQRVRAAYIAMDVITWYVIVPLSGASLLTGLIQSLSTTWGVFRHYWVVAKLLITIGATTILLLHTQAIGHVADAATRAVLSADDLRQLRIQLVADAAAALLALLVATGLSVYKPGGLTRYGRRKQDEERQPSPLASPRPSSTPRWVYASGIVAAGLVLLFIILHLTGRGLGGH